MIHNKGNNNGKNDLLRAKDFWEKLSISKSKFYEMVKKMEIPKGITKDYPKMTYWFRDEVEYYLQKFPYCKNSKDYENLSKDIIERRLTRY